MLCKIFFQALDHFLLSFFTKTSIESLKSSLIFVCEISFDRFRKTSELFWIVLYRIRQNLSAFNRPE
jgi:hypothetical protein